jgi:hypothetical protein
VFSSLHKIVVGLVIRFAWYIIDGLNNGRLLVVDDAECSIDGSQEIPFEFIIFIVDMKSMVVIVDYRR